MARYNLLRYNKMEFVDTWAIDFTITNANLFYKFLNHLQIFLWRGGFLLNSRSTCTIDLRFQLTKDDFFYHVAIFKYQNLK